MGLRSCRSLDGIALRESRLRPICLCVLQSSPVAKMDDNYLEANGSTVCLTIATDPSAAIGPPAARGGANTRVDTSAGPVEDAPGRPRTLLLVDDEENI